MVIHPIRMQLEVYMNIERINELARKQKSVGLTEEEKKEQAILRREYIDSVLGSLRGHLDNTYIVDENNVAVKLTAKNDSEDDKDH